MPTLRIMKIFISVIKWLKKKKEIIKHFKNEEQLKLNIAHPIK